jgi:hypothetical protein
MRRILNFAERQGFEPWDLLTGVNGFRDRPIRPLWHLSGFGTAKIGTIWLRAKNYGKEVVIGCGIGDV